MYRSIQDSPTCTLVKKILEKPRELKEIFAVGRSTWKLSMLVADSGFPRRGVTPEFWEKTYYLARLLLKSARKWKKGVRP